MSHQMRANIAEIVQTVVTCIIINVQDEIAQKVKASNAVCQNNGVSS
jgi:hypothetical protein